MAKEPHALLSLPDLTSELGRQFVAAMQGLLEGAAQDLEQYGAAIAAEVVAASQAQLLGRDPEHAMAHLRAQAKVLLGIHRLRAQRQADDALLLAVDLATRTLASVFSAGLK